MAKNNTIIGTINFITLLLSIPIIGAGIRLANEPDNYCVKILQWPLIILGISISVVALLGFVGGCWRITLLLIFYLVAMFILIVQVNFIISSFKFQLISLNSFFGCRTIYMLISYWFLQHIFGPTDFYWFSFTVGVLYASSRMWVHLHKSNILAYSQQHSSKHGLFAVEQWPDATLLPLWFMQSRITC